MKKNILKAFAGDLIYSIGALVLLNGVIQLVVYPYLQKQMGADSFGIVLSILSVISIMATSFGTGANYSRMVVSTKVKEVKGDYNIFLAVICTISLIVSLVTVFTMGECSITAFLGLAILMVLSILRYYGDVNFRLELDYKGFFLYYVAITVGYVLGVLLYGVIGSWCITLILGELLATVFVAAKGNIYKRPLFKKSENFSSNIKSIVTLSSAYLISNIVLNADRILLLTFVGSAEVTIFYTSTLVGKIVALLTAPLNGVIIGYLSRYKGGITKKMMAGLTAALLVIGAVVTVGGMIVSYIFVSIMYPDVFEQAKPLFLVANAGQIFYFISETFMVVVLRFTKERLQLYINIVYAIIFFAVAIPSVISAGLMGMAYAILGMNIFRFALISIIGIKSAHGRPLNDEI